MTHPAQLKERGVPYDRLPDKFWRQQAARGKVRRFKAPDMAGRVQAVFSFYSQHGFDSTNGVHLFTEKTAIVHAAQMELIHGGAMADPCDMPYMNVGTEETPKYINLTGSGKIEGHHVRLQSILSTGKHLFYYYPTRVYFECSVSEYARRGVRVRLAGPCASSLFSSTYTSVP